MKKVEGIPGKFRKLTAEENRERIRIVVDLVHMKDRLARAGLYETMHLLDAAVKRVGYEHADDMRRWAKGEDLKKQKAQWSAYLKAESR